MAYTMKNQKTQFKAASGFTLIEVLITVVILSIGLLGMAGIQIQGLRGTTNSTLRSQATILANDMAERIRMTADGVFVTDADSNEHYSIVSISSDPEADNNFACGAGVAPTFCSVTPTAAATADCTTAQAMATFDIYDFACGLGHNAGVLNSLPNASATITCNDAINDCPAGSELTINVNWSEVSANDGSRLDKTVTMVVIP